MKFLQQLEEAANIPLDQLKDRMKKDPRVKMIFTRDLQLDQLKDPAEFIRTLRYYIFSNPHVRDFIEKRGDRRDISKHWWQRIASTKPTDNLTQMDIHWLQSVVKELFKDFGFVQKKDISKRGFEAFMDWYNRDRNVLDAYTSREIDSLDIKPAGPIVVYQGLSFDERSMRSEDFSGSDGLKFLKSIREGTRVVDIKKEEHSMWTTDKDLALNQALYGRDAAWKKHTPGEPKKMNRGVMAFVVSTLVGPDDILVDLREFKKIYNWPGVGHSAENGVVLKPGTYVSRVVSRHTPEGEEDPVVRRGEDEPDLDTVAQQLTLFGRILKLPFPKITFEGLDRFGYDPEGLAQIKILLDPETQEKIGKLLNSVLSFYKKHIEPLSEAKLATQAGTNTEAFLALKKLHDLFDSSISHRAYANPNAPSLRGRQLGSPSIKDLRSGDDMLTAVAFGISHLDTAAAAIATQKRWTGWNVTSALGGFAKVADPNYKPPEKIHLAAWKEQKKLADLAMDGFYKIVGKSKPDSYPEQAKEFIALVTEATRVSRAARFLQDVKAAATSAGT